MRTILLLFVVVFASIMTATAFADSDAPSKPVLHANAISPTSIMLTWSVENPGDAPITGYKIERKEFPSGSYTTIVANTGNNQTTYTDTGRTTDKQYGYRVSAINEHGPSNQSIEHVATPTLTSVQLAQITPSSPTLVRASAISPTSIELSWSAPADNNGPPITGYKIERIVDTSIIFQRNVPATDTTYVVTSLTTGTSYVYRISAVNSVGTGSPSIQFGATPAADSTRQVEQIVPSSPTRLKVVPLSQSSLAISWQAPSDNNSPPVTGYKLEFRSTSSGDYASLTLGNILSFTHEDLTTSTYTYRVSAINTVGDSNPSSTASGTPKRTNSPTQVTATPASPTSINLRWLPPSETYGNSISRYTIEEVDANGIPRDEFFTPGPVTMYTIDRLTTDKTYYFNVKADFSTSISSGTSATVSATPTATSVDNTAPSFTRPDPPTNLQASAQDSDTISLRWSAPRNDGGSPITSYKIDVKVGDAEFSTLESNTDGTGTSFTSDGRSIDVEYTYKVYAINAAGPSRASNEASATTVQQVTDPKTIPSNPRGLNVDGSADQAKLSWTEPSNDGNSRITSYKIEVKIDDGAFTVLQEDNGPSTSFTHIDITLDTKYTYRVTAINSIGSSSPSNPRSFTATDPDIPVIPEPASDPKKRVPGFPDPAIDPQVYIDRYNNEEEFRTWFDSAFPDYTIQELVIKEEPKVDPIPEPASDPKKRVPGFPDPAVDPQTYIDRYNNEVNYKKWFDSTFPDYSIYDVVGVVDPSNTTNNCGPGTVFSNGQCILTGDAGDSGALGGGCLIATATFDSELAPQVQLLREVRDDTLISTSFGTSFMTGFNNVYYTFSPGIADLEREHPVFKQAVKTVITPMIYSLGIMTLAQHGSEYQVLLFGISVIALNLAMYIAAPVFVTFKVSKYLKSRK